MKRFLKHPEILFGTLCEHAPEGVLLVDNRGDFIHANPAVHRLFGYPSGKMQGQNLKKLFLKKTDGTAVWDFLGGSLPDLFLSEIRMKKKNGEALFADISLSGVETKQERLVVAFIRDVTRRRQLTQEKRKNEILLSNIFNAIEDGISLLDTNLTVKRTNAWMEKMYAETMPLVGRKCYEVYQQRTSPCPFCPSLPALKEGKPHRATVPYPSEKAPRGWSELYAYPLTNTEGKVTGIVEYVRDITEQKRLQKIITESEKKFRAFFENSAIFAYISTTEGQFLDVNEAGARLLGYTKEELLKLKASDTYYNPEDRKYFLNAIEKNGFVKDFPLQLKRKNGEMLSVRITSTLIRDAQENIVGFHGIIRDVTVQEKKEKELNLLNTLISQTDTEVVITDIDGNIEYVNPGFEKITGYSAREVIGQNPRILKSGHHDTAFYKNLWDTITSGKPWNGQFINKRKDGTFYHEDAHIFPVKDKENHIINFAAIKQDITHEVSLEEQLRQAAKLEAIGQLAGGIAHDFNNVLTSIQGFAEIGMSRLKTGDSLREDFLQILKAAKQAARISSQLLGFSRKQIISPQVISVNQVLRELHSVLTQLIGEDIDFLYALCNKGDTILADRGQIEQCVMNLVINARDAIHQKKDKSKERKITIETSPVMVGESYVREHININKGPYVVIAISDTGIGMDKDTLSKIFDPFFTTKETGQGTGLGCSTVFGIVRQNNGIVQAYSEPGVGTTIKLYWPASDKEVPAEESEETMMPIPANGTETILVVEDDEGIREFVSQALDALGYTVYSAATGEDALKLVEDKKLVPDLLFTDVVMPGMDGTELAKALSSRIPHLKTIFSSGYTANHIAHNGFLDKNVHFLHKPYTYRKLTQKIRNVLDGETPNFLSVTS